jgi:PTS system nitrogen regulatory IIA component
VASLHAAETLVKLSVRDAAELLAQPETMLYRWIKEGTLPAYKMNDRYWLNRAELLEWATKRGITVSLRMFHDADAQAPPSIADALARGGVHHHVPSTTTEATLREVVQRLPLPEGDDPECLLQMLLAREALGSTAVGGGIAFPHVRSPIVLSIDDPIVSVCFLDGTIDLESIDGEPVHTLFTLVTPSVRAHLHLLSRLAHLLRDARFHEAVKAKASHETILALAREIEARVEHWKA